jgi:imidazolonepropionase-like amidohydrolase
MSSIFLKNSLIWYWTCYPSAENSYRPEGLARKGSLLVSNGKIQKISFEDEQEEEIVLDENSDVIVDMEGKLILPGLIGGVFDF